MKLPQHQQCFTFFPKPDSYELIGSTNEPQGIEKFDPIFEMDVKYYEDQVTFTQRIAIIDPKLTHINAEVFFSVCDDKRCLPPEVIEFTIPLHFNKDMKVSDASVELSQQDKEKSQALHIDVKGWDRFPNETIENKSYITIFILGFIGGLLALLTPCVFPMIPLTVSFFTKSNSHKAKGIFNASMYGFFIFMIYILLSLPFHILDSLDPEILNTISTNVFLNLLFFVIFLVFAISFFGYFEITLPASWSNRLDAKANTLGGVLGIFFMALTLALVSFSCTGPILGSLLGGSLSSNGGAIQLSFGMGGFGLALALPFALFAMFPNWLVSLPKSGGWLNTVKVLLGFIELGLAFKFLSNADLVKHWGILPREIFIGIWIIICVAMILYVLGKIRFPHDAPLHKIPVKHKAIAFILLIFTLYLMPGLSNTKFANLKLLSGFPPPLFYSVFEKDTKGPLGLKAYKDFEEGVKAARLQNKPILLDFTGWACVNCRKMEEQVWSYPEIMKILKEKYILISLYVDDRKKLANQKQFKYLKANNRLKKIKTIGDKWATFQTLNFKNNSQPYYVLLDSNFNLLNHTTAYTPDVNDYLKWLQKGLDNFKKN